MELTDEDFPAAHSMDTVFFAVDSEGCIALFSTGEAGALPNESLAGDGAYEARQSLIRLLPRCGVLEDPLGRILPTSGTDERHSSSVGSQTLMFLDSLEPVRQAIDEGRAKQMGSIEPMVAVVFRTITEEDYRRLHDEKLCRGCVWSFGAYDPPEPDEEDYSDQGAHFGLYEYGHLCENWIAGPYGRERVPQHPIHIDQLPPDLQNMIGGGLRFDFRFAETPHIQPAEHVECSAWSEDYLGVDGKTYSLEDDEEIDEQEET